MQALEITGTVDQEGRLSLDQPIQLPHPGRVRIILLLEEDLDRTGANMASQTTLSTVGQSVTVHQLNFDSGAKPIWELASEISAQVPDEEWRKLPTDLARNFDEYQRQRQRQERD